MILKEIGFDMPYIPETKTIQELSYRENISYEEASILNYKLKWEEKRSILNTETEALCAKVASLMPKNISYNFWKLMVNCTEELNSECVDEVEGILSIDVQFDYNKYRQNNNSTKIDMQIEALNTAIHLANKHGYTDLLSILSITKEIYGENFLHKWIWKKIRLKNGITASIVMNHKIEVMEISVKYENIKTGKLFEKVLKKTDPSPFIYTDYLGKLIANGDDGIELISRNGDFILKDRVTPR